MKVSQHTEQVINKFAEMMIKRMEEMKNNKIIYPPKEILDNTEIYLELPEETNLLIDELWRNILSEDKKYNSLVVPIALAIIITLCIIIAMKKRKMKKS